MTQEIGRPLSWYDCAPDYLDGEEDLQQEDERRRQEAEDDHIDEILMQREGN